MSIIRSYFTSLYFYLEFYDLNNPEDCSLIINQICKMIIHSFIFYPGFNEHEKMKFTGIFVNTDFTTDVCIYYIEYKVFITLIQEVINDDVIAIAYNRQSGKIKKSRYHIE